jgi:hypothetical protein
MFILKLRPRPGIDGVKALRWVLKRAGRLGLTAIDVTEQQEGDAQPAQPAKQANETDKHRKVES